MKHAHTTITPIDHQLVQTMSCLWQTCGGDGLDTTLDPCCIAMIRLCYGEVLRIVMSLDSLQ